MADPQRLEFSTRIFRCLNAKNILMLEECGQRHSTAKCPHFLGYGRVFLRKMSKRYFYSRFRK